MGTLTGHADEDFVSAVAYYMNNLCYFIYISIAPIREHYERGLTYLMQFQSVCHVYRST